MNICIIMHYMSIKYDHNFDAPIEDVRESTAQVERVVNETIRFNLFTACHTQIKDKNAYIALCNILIYHLWEEYTSSNG